MCTLNVQLKCYEISLTCPPVVCKCFNETYIGKFSDKLYFLDELHKIAANQLWDSADTSGYFLSTVSKTHYPNMFLQNQISCHII